MTKWAWAVGAVVAATFAMGGCKPKVGAKCKSGQEQCTDKANGLFCGSDDKYAAMSCGGPKGCVQTGQDVNCDNSLASAGDGCETEDDVSCSTDKKAALECHGGKFDVGSTCKGPKGCTLDDDKISCDNNVADVNDACHFDDDYACWTDKQIVLRCESKKMIAYNACRGPNGCVVKEEPIEKKVVFDCDDTFANEGDACDNEGNPACSTDKKNLLKCTSGKFAVKKACGGAKGCEYDTASERFFCDGSAAGNHTASQTKKAATGGTASGTTPAASASHAAASSSAPASATASASAAPTTSAPGTVHVRP
ncbi:MAG TPA: hypothetical protein VF407_08080, partial [Polyangiaceae bacterium]